MYGGARRYAVHLARTGRWPPPAPVFSAGGEHGLSLFRRWTRHMWLECDAGFGQLFVMGGVMGVGKSAGAKRVGSAMDPDFDLDLQFVYTGEEFLEANNALGPNRPIFMDEALSRTLWSVLWQESDQQAVVREFWEKIRSQKHPVGVVAQDEKRMTDAVANGIASWWFRGNRRDPVSGTKVGVLYHCVYYVKRDKVTKGYKMEVVPRYYPAGQMMIPGSPETEMRSYERRRKKGLRSGTQVPRSRRQDLGLPGEEVFDERPARVRGE